jgi:ABC-type sugar transport system substrate-binding protein
MHRIIIPIDFSETSLNAARYTAKMLSGKEDAMAVIYNNYESEDDYDVVIGYQESLKKEFKKYGVINVEYENEMGGDLIENIARLAHDPGYDDRDGDYRQIRGKAGHVWEQYIETG